MKIVYVTPRIPYPPTKGDKIRAYHHLQHLSRYHEVHLVSLVDRNDKPDLDVPLRDWCASISLVQIKMLGVAARIARALTSATPFVTSAFAVPQLRRVVESVADSDTDILWICNGALFPTLGEVRARHRILDLVDVDSDKWRQLSEQAGCPRAAVYRREARLTRRQEASAVRSAERCVVVSTAEANQLRQRNPTSPPAHVVTNGVDFDAFPLTELADDPILLFTGALDYAPNIDAVKFFASEVLPAVRTSIPDTQFLVVGSRPGLTIHQTARRYDFELAADVTDIQPYFAAARAFVAPMRIGRGLQNKVLEAMASGVPVIATPIALAGLAEGHEWAALRAESPEALARACVELLSDHGRSLRLAASARRFVTAHHTWEAAYTAIDTLVAGLEDTLPSEHTSSAQEARPTAPS